MFVDDEGARRFAACGGSGTSAKRCLQGERRVEFLGVAKESRAKPADAAAGGAAEAPTRGFGLGIIVSCSVGGSGRREGLADNSTIRL